MATFGHPDRRRGFALGRFAARTLLAERLGCAPGEVPLNVAEGGAPLVRDTPLHVSISHAGKGAGIRAAAAVGPRPIGVDLEAIVPRRSDLHARILQPEEQGLRATLPYDANTSQLLLWSLKEAVLKGLRTGFRRPARSIRLLVVADGRAEAEAGEGGRWALLYERRGDFWLTVAVLDAQ